MRTLSEVLFLLPTLVSLGGLVFFLHRSGRGYLQRMLAFLFAMMTICAICGFCTAEPELLGKWTMITDLLSWILGPVMLASIICLFYSRFHETRLPWYMYLWFVVPVAFGSVLSVLLRLTGIDQMWACSQACNDNAYTLPEEYLDESLFCLHHEMVSIQYLLILGIYIVAALGYGCWILKRTGYTLGEGHGFNFRGGTMPPLHILVFAFFQLFALLLIFMALGRGLVLEYPMIRAILSMMMAVCLTEVIVAGRCIDYEEVSCRQLYSFKPIEFSYPMDEEEEVVLVMPMEANDKDLEERLQSGLDRVMDEMHVFCQCGVKIEEVARMIGTNRLYLSRYINQKYQMNFNEYLNRKRVEYSKEYLKSAD